MTRHKHPDGSTWDSRETGWVKVPYIETKVTEPTTAAGPWRDMYVTAVQWIAWWLERYDLAEDATPEDALAAAQAEARAAALDEAYGAVMRSALYAIDALRGGDDDPFKSEEKP